MTHAQVMEKQQKAAYGAELQAQIAASEEAKRREKMERRGIAPGGGGMPPPGGPPMYGQMPGMGRCQVWANARCGQMLGIMGKCLVWERGSGEGHEE